MQSHTVISQLIICFSLPTCLGLSHIQASDSSVGSEFILVRDSQPAAAIITSASPTENVRKAAAELQKYLEIISSARLPLATDDNPPAGCRILVGPSKLTEAIPQLEIPSGRTKNFREEGFIIRTYGQNLVLAGNDTKPYLDHLANYLNLCLVPYTIMLNQTIYLYTMRLLQKSL